MELADHELDILLKATRKWGREFQAVLAMEELGELIQAISKMYRFSDGQAYTNLMEEVVDVQIMLDHLKVLHKMDLKALQYIRDSKFSKLSHLIDRTS